VAANSRWGVVGASVRGARHIRAGTPNQDAWVHDTAGTQTTLICIADGHGGSEHFRSDVGAALAVEAGMSVLRAAIDDDVPKRVVEAWRKAVDEHLATAPYQGGESPRDARLPYGCTFLGIGAGEDGIRFWQLGDGDILCIDGDGNTTRLLAADPRLMGNQTTSLCMEDAASEFRVGSAPANDGDPAMIVISTDGYSNSFETEADFLQIGRDYLEMLRASGADAVGKELPAILEDTSRNGSGDDITLALLYRDIPGPERGPEKQKQQPRKKRGFLRRNWRRAADIVTLLLVLARTLSSWPY
jgi:Protein phosphatase 2C